MEEMIRTYVVVSALYAIVSQLGKIPQIRHIPSRLICSALIKTASATLCFDLISRSSEPNAN